MRAIHRLSKILQPITIISKGSNNPHKDVTSKSQRLMLELGVIQQAHTGSFHFLPLGLRALDKLVKIVDEEMASIGGQKIMFPTLVKADLWTTSGRADAMGSELMTLKDRHNHKYILCPTHEETASHLLQSLAPISYKRFPLLIYQITSKYRDEMKPRFGLIRGREFVMKDLYSFDVDKLSAMETYEKVAGSYDRVFKRIGINFVKVLGTSGTMGGDLSHEYHYRAAIGDDKIFVCHNCDFSANVDLMKTEKCPKCDEGKNVSIQSSIEVGHTFLLGDKYSKPLNAKYLSHNAKPQLLQMGSYGLGLSRILAASVEVLSLEQEMRWPDSLAPFNVVVVPPKAGSREEATVGPLAERLYASLEREVPELKQNVLLDDRTNLTVGRRFLDARRVGYRFVIVLNKLSSEDPPQFEMNDLARNSQMVLQENQIIKYIKENINT
ncbi:probable proline--tRNA ligase, mitochondrial [Cylas formicarius]|uniref:probable proline--tRNA ligase, mitochondrial n=1 Tax=Cylas formicarius TaxID=197179 RepID=UPI0029584729|nr:probable proline--tRNA ligase, mitochondrial [Cylas formicarius]